MILKNVLVNQVLEHLVLVIERWNWKKKYVVEYKSLRKWLENECSRMEM